MKAEDIKFFLRKHGNGGAKLEQIIRKTGIVNFRNTIIIKNIKEANYLLSSVRFMKNIKRNLRKYTVCLKMNFLKKHTRLWSTLEDRIIFLKYEESMFNHNIF